MTADLFVTVNRCCAFLKIHSFDYRVLPESALQNYLGLLQLALLLARSLIRFALPLYLLRIVKDTDRFLPHALWRKRLVGNVIGDEVHPSHGQFLVNYPVVQFKHLCSNKSCRRCEFTEID